MRILIDETLSNKYSVKSLYLNQALLYPGDPTVDGSAERGLEGTHGLPLGAYTPAKTRTHQVHSGCHHAFNYLSETI